MSYAPNCGPGRGDRAPDPYVERMKLYADRVEATFRPVEALPRWFRRLVATVVLQHLGLMLATDAVRLFQQ